MSGIPLLNLCSCKKHARYKLPDGSVSNEFCSFHGALDEIERLVQEGRMPDTHMTFAKIQVPSHWPLQNKEADGIILMRCAIWNDPSENVPQVQRETHEDPCVSGSIH